MTRVLLAWLVCGVSATLAGFLGFLYVPLSVVLMVPVVSLGYYLYLKLQILGKIVAQRQWWEVSAVVMLILIWGLHLMGVFVPETGFDAVWYHLPIIDHFVAQHRIVYMPELYQSANPLFSDLLFLLGYQVGGEFGAKIVAYLLAMSLVGISYELARQYLSRGWALLFVVSVSLIQVVTWQSSSVYVDVAKALWEIGALYFLVTQHGHLRQSALFFGASLATKQFSILLWPLYIGIVYWRTKSLRQVLEWLWWSVVMPFPFYLHSWFATGHPLYSITLHSTKVAEIGADTTLFSHFATQLLHLPYSLWMLIFEVRDYVSPLLFLLLPFLFIRSRSRQLLTPLLAFGVWQYFVWWFVPPLSTRYALSGFIVLLVALFVAVSQWLKYHRQWRVAVIVGIVIVDGFLLLPRLYVATRSWTYLKGDQGKISYLEQFMDGHIDIHLKKWHAF